MAKQAKPRGWSASPMSSVAVVGAGAWGTALAIQAARAGSSVTLWARTPGALAARASPRLPGFPLPDAIDVTGELPRRADAILMAVPMQHLRAVLRQMQPQAPLLLCCKGVESERLRLPLEISEELHPDVPAAVLTGPNFAREIAAGLPAASVIAGRNAELRRQLIALLATGAFRLYGNDDPIGAQFGGAAKNVIAIAAGALVGGGFGENARAGLITRGLAELSRLVVAQGGRADTVAGLSGLGDLVLTCTGTGSRNYAYGLAIGRGEHPGTTDEAPVVEGVATAPALLARAPNVDLPICRGVAALIAGRLTLAEAMAEALARKLRDE
jgi:glycerol-3-phosphate dehydrogenase (NAD(P)+)